MGLLLGLERTLTARSKNAESYVPPGFQGADSWVDVRVADDIAIQLFANFSILLDELLLVPVPIVDVPAPVLAPVAGGVVGVATVPVAVGPGGVVGAFQTVGTGPFIGFAGFEPVRGGETVVTPDGFRVHPG